MAGRHAYLGALVIAIVAVLVLLVPTSASAHLGHHDAIPLSLAGSQAADVDATGHGGSSDLVIAVVADDPGCGSAARCHRLCRCTAGGAGCAAPAVGVEAGDFISPVVVEAPLMLRRDDEPYDALLDRLRKPPRA